MAHLAYYAPDAFGAVLQHPHSVPNGRNDVFTNDPERRGHKQDACQQGRGADDQRGDVHKGQVILCRFRLAVHRGVQSGNVLFDCTAPVGNVPVGGGVGVLGFAVRAGAGQMDQRRLEFFIIFPKRAVNLHVFFGHERLVGRQLFVQHSLLRLDLLDQSNHGRMVLRHDMGQRQRMNVHDGPPYLLQTGFADHVLVHDGPRVGVDVVDTEHRQNIGQKGHQSQQEDGQNQTLL